MNKSAGQESLAGRQFLVTRPQEQARGFIAKLEQLGATAHCIPTIEIVEPKSWAPLDLALRDLDDFDIIIFTSANAVSAFFERLLENNQYYGILTQLTVVAVGPKTAEALRGNFTRVDIVPDEHRAEGVVAQLLQRGVAGQKVLYPRAEVVRPVLVDGLKQAGAEVCDPIAYRTVIPTDNRDQIRALLEGGALDAICFSSSSTFKNLATMLGDDLKPLLDKTRLFSIGPVTSETIRQYGCEVDLEPRQWTLDALLAAMIEYYKH